MLLEKFQRGKIISVTVYAHVALSATSVYRAYVSADLSTAQHAVTAVWACVRVDATVLVLVVLQTLLRAEHATTLLAWQRGRGDAEGRSRGGTSRDRREIHSTTRIALSNI